MINLTGVECSFWVVIGFFSLFFFVEAVTVQPVFRLA